MHRKKLNIWIIFKGLKVEKYNHFWKLTVEVILVYSEVISSYNYNSNATKVNTEKLFYSTGQGSNQI